MLQSENVMTFSDLARALPMVNGKRINQSTIWRWALKGCRGVRLETMRLGARYLSSVEAVERYGRAVAEASVEQLAYRQAQRDESAKALVASVPPLAPLPSKSIRKKQIEKAEAELAASGW